MSVVRTSSSASRRAARADARSPYKRTDTKQPQNTQRSFWGRLLEINPLNYLFNSKDEPDSDSEYEPVEDEAAHALARRGEQLAEQSTPTTNVPPSPPQFVRKDPQPGPPPASTVAPEASQETVDPSNLKNILLDELASQGTDTRAVEKFLREKGDQPLNKVEYAGILALLARRVQDDETVPVVPEPEEPFRFRSSTNSMSPEPGRVRFATPSDGAPARPPRMLSKNPNGPYILRGAGSARPRNRYQSPAFGSSRPPAPKIRIAPPEKPRTDTKRRRVGADVEFSSAQSVPAAQSPPQQQPQSQPRASSSPSPPTTNGHPTTNGTAPPSTPRARLPARATTPARPSPLRQAWSQSDSPPSQSSSPQGDKPQAERGAPVSFQIFNAMVEKVSTPPKKPLHANPYQEANPLLTKPASRKPATRRTRKAKAAGDASSGAAAPEQKTEPKLSTQKVIEATVPLGSKRSRPPPDMENARANANASTDAPAPRRSTRLQSPEAPAINGMNGTIPSVVVEEVDDEESGSPAKKQKTSPSLASAVLTTNGRAGTSRASVSLPTVEEIEDVEMPSSRSSSVTHPSEVVEPSESRGSSTAPPASAPLFGAFGSNAAASAQRSAFPGLKSSAPRVSSKLRYSIQGEDEEKQEAVEEVEVPEKKQKDANPFGGLGLGRPSVSAFPTTTPVALPLNKTADISTPVPPRDAKAVALAKPTSDLPKYTLEIPLSSPGAGPSSFKARQRVKDLPADKLPTFDFANVPKAPTSIAATLLPFGASSGSAPSGFNWGVACAKPPAKSSGEQWTCSMCMLQNPDSVKEKCAVCDAPRPGQAAAAPKSTQPENPLNSAGAAPAVSAFNWGAAGMKQAEKPATAEWKCPMCMLKNPDSAKDKCTICEAPRPVAPVASGFNWSAAGMEAPAAPSEGTWTCKVCMLSNPESVKDKCNICDAPR